MPSLTLIHRSPFVLLVALLALTISAVGCSGGSGSEKNAEEEKPEKTLAEKKAEAKQIKLDRIEREFELAMKRVKKDPTNFRIHIGNLEGVLFGAKGTKFEKQIEDEIAKLKEGLAQFAEEELDKLLGAVEKELANDEWDEALRTLEQYETYQDYFTGLPAWKRYEGELDRVRTLEQAESAARTVLEKARKFKRRGEVAQAIGLLVGFPDKYDNTKYYTDVQKMIDEYMVEYKLVLAERTKQEETPFVDVEIDEYLSNFDHVATAGDEDVWSGVDGVAEADNDTEMQNVPLVLGTDEWQDWIVEFTIKFKGGEMMYLGVTSGKKTFRSEINQFAVYNFPDLEEDTWYKLRLEVREGQFSVINLEDGSFIKEDVRKRNETGGVAFWPMPDQKVYVKGLRYKVLTQIEKEEDDEEPDSDDESGGDGSGDG